MAGYCGYSKSNSAVQAEANYRFPRTILCKKLGFSPTKFDGEPCEWHHTSKRYNCVDYYDSLDFIRTRDVIRYSVRCPSQSQYALRLIVKAEVINEIGRFGYKAQNMRNAARELLSQESRKNKSIVAAKKAKEQAVARELSRRQAERTAHIVAAMTMVEGATYVRRDLELGSLTGRRRKRKMYKQGLLLRMVTLRMEQGCSS